MVKSVSQLVQSRRISGKGILKADTPSVNPLRWMWELRCSVIRMPSIKYENENYNPSRSRYGTICLERNGYIIQTLAIEFEYQSFDFVSDIGSQTLAAVQCGYEGTLISFANLGSALGLTVTGVTNNIKDWGNLDTFWEIAYLQCYADTALQLDLYETSYEICPDQSPNPNFGGGGHSKPSPVPPKTPLSSPGDLSSPYDGTTDNGNSVPFPLDVPAAPTPEGNACQVYTITVRVTYIQPGKGPETSSVQVYGQYADIRINPENPKKLELKCQGIVGGGATCGTFTYYELNDSGIFNTYESATILSVS